MTRVQGIAAAAAVLMGAALGLGAFTFVYAKGYSYLGTDPAACANCHVMDEHYDAWLKSSHRAVAGCNDCHTPHDPVGKYVTKARNGFWHSFYFTTGDFPDPLRITPGNREITENTCRDCHGAITDAIEHGTDPPAEKERRREGREEAFYCTRCHDDVGHWIQ